MVSEFALAALIGRALDVNGCLAHAVVNGTAGLTGTPSKVNV